MPENQIKNQLRKMTRDDLMKLLATYSLLEQGKSVTDKAINGEIESNFMREVAREDLMVEILNSRGRLGIV